MTNEELTEIVTQVIKGVLAERNIVIEPPIEIPVVEQVQPDEATSRFTILYPNNGW